jgi:formylglycine-generating enzyme required for sulfatase activity
MSSLADLTELVGFFSYSRRDDEHSEGALSRLRARINSELRLQLGREFRLWQDTAAIPEGALWEDQINEAIATSSFFIPIVTPSAIRSRHCRFEFEAFLKREAALERNNLIFPIIYVRVPALEREEEWRRDDVLKIIGERQYVDWDEVRLRRFDEPEVAERVRKYCKSIAKALHQPWVSPEQRRAAEERARQEAEEEARQSAERQRLAREADEKRRSEEAERLAREAEQRQEAEEEKRRRKAADAAQYLATTLYRRFGPKRIFVCIPGTDGGEYWLRTPLQIAASEAMVVLIGKGWSDLKDEQGNRRIDNPNDPVRFEIAQRLARGLPLLPVLLGDAAMPETAQLPDQLMMLTQTQAMRLRGERFEQDADAIARRLKAMLAPRRAGGAPIWALSLGLGAVLLGGVVGLSLLAMPGGEAQLHAAADDARQRAIAAEDRAARAERAAETSESARRSLLRDQDGLKDQRDEALKETANLKAMVTTAQKEAAAARESADAAQKQRDEARKDADIAKKRVADLQAAENDRRRAEAEAKRRADEEAARRDPARSITPASGQSFRDLLADGSPCPMCPEMVVAPAGTFTMGSAPSEPERNNDEEQVRVTITRPFAVGKFAVTFDQWDACVADGGCNGYRPADQGWGRGNRPVINVNWNDAKAFAEWLSRKTGKTYRLPSEAEREYATRAGTTTPFWWGSSISPNQANYDGSHIYAGGPIGEYRQRTLPVDSFKANPWGLFNVHGNVWEWTEDCWNASNQGSPGNGTARTTVNCKQRVVRGGSWNNVPRLLRAAGRDGTADTNRDFVYGFRLARTLSP